MRVATEEIMKYWNNVLLGTFIVGSVVALPAKMAAAQAGGPCVDSASVASRGLKSVYEALVSLSDPESVALRNQTGIPTLTPSQVKLVADTTVCRAASIAYDARLQAKRPAEPVIVIELGTKHVVMKQAENGGRSLDMLFSAGFTTVLNMFWQ
jgi:hypothetical protein